MRSTLLMLAACGKVAGGPTDAPAGDAPIDGASGRCDPGRPFAAPTIVPNVNTSNDDTTFAVVADEQTAFINRVVQPPAPSATLVVSQRLDSGDFTTPSAALTATLNNVIGDEYAASPNADGLTLYFHRQTSNGIGVVAATRSDVGVPFPADSAVSVNGSGLIDALNPTISADGQTLYWVDFTTFHLKAARRGGTPTTFGAASELTNFEVLGIPVLTSDELTLYYNRGNLGEDVFVTTRASRTDRFELGTAVSEVNSPQNDYAVAISRDNCVLYLATNRNGGLGGFDIWRAARPR